VWLIITYKRGGSRAKPDEYPLGVCDVCGEVRRLAWKDTCPKCGAELESLAP
jgi:rRNA maturation protein Nop10